MADIPKKRSKFMSNLMDGEETLSTNSQSGYIDTGVGVAGDIVGAVSADRAHKGQATGKAIGGGVGAGIGAALAGPLGAQVGGQLGSMVGSLIGAGSDKKRAIAAATEASRKENMNIDLTANVNPYGQYAEGGLVEGGGEEPGKGEKRSTSTTPQYRKLNAQEMNEWNSFIDFVEKKGLSGSKELDNRNKNMGLDLFNQYKAANPNISIGYDIVPHAQNEFQQFRTTHRNFASNHGIDPNSQMDNISKVDGWFGSFTSKQRFIPMVSQVTDSNGRVISSNNMGLMNGQGTPTSQMGSRRTSNSKPIPKGVQLEELMDSTGRKYKGYMDPDSGDMVEVFEEGGAVGTDLLGAQYGLSEQPPIVEQPQSRTINIEKGELLSDKEGNILERYMNPNRYSPHASNQFKEPNGNFVEVPADGVVIPKKLAKRFERGDVLTRRSIMRQLVDNQVQNPSINTPKGSKQFAAGGFTGPGDEYDEFGNLIPKGQKQAGYSSTEPSRPHIERTTNGSGTPVILTNPDQNRTIPDGYMTDFADEVSYFDNGTIATQDEMPASSSTLPGKRKLDFAMLGRRVGSKLPALYQMVNAMQGDPHLRKEYNTRFDEARSHILQTDDSYNVQDQIAAIDTNTAQALQMIGQNNSPSARAEAAAIIAKANEAKGQVLAGAARYKGGVRNNMLAQLANLDVQQGQSNQAEDLRYQTELRMNAANDQNMVANALNENYRMDAGWHTDMEKVRMLNEMSKYEDINPMEVARFTSDPNAVQRIFAAIQSGTAKTFKEAIEAEKQRQTTSRSATTSTSSKNTKAKKF